MGTKNFDNALDLITFSRTSGGTALRRVGYGSELVTNGTFDTDLTGWTAATAVTTALDNNTMRVSYTTGAGGTFYIGAYQSFSTAIGRQYKATVDVTSVSSNTGRVRFEQSPGGGQNGNYTSLGLGSYTFYFVATATTTYINLGMASDATGSVGFDNISVKEVIFDRATDPLVLFTHPAEIPRIEYDAAGAVKGLLIEEARTNLLTYSEAFDNAAWTKINLSLGSGEISPDGTTVSDRLTATVTGSTHTYPNARSSTIGVTYSTSVFAKAATHGIVQLNVPSSGNIFVNFDLTTGAKGVENDCTANIEPIGGGWYRCSMTWVATSTTNSFGLSIVSLITSGRSTFTTSGYSVDVYGAQLEAGSFPTSYIPAISGSTVTRAADVASILVSAFGYNQTAGSVVVEATALSNVAGDYNSILSLQSDINNRVDLGQISNDGYQVINVAGTAVAGWNEGTAQNKDRYLLGVPHTTGIAFKTNSAIPSLDGVNGTEDTALTIPVPTVLLLGDDSSTRKLNGHIKSIQYYPRRLSNAQLQELTT